MTEKQAPSHKTFIVCYDLKGEHKDYARLIETIDGLSGVRAKVLESTWIINHPGPAAAIRDEIVKVMDKDDKLLVFEIAINGADYNLGNTVSGFLKMALAMSAGLIPHDVKTKPAPQ